MFSDPSFEMAIQPAHVTITAVASKLTNAVLCDNRLLNIDICPLLYENELCGVMNSTDSVV